MKKQSLFLSLLSLLMFLVACQRELSLEKGNTRSQGSLQSDITGDCLPKTVAGAYEEGVPLDENSNYIEIEVDVTLPGSYTISSDTINGIYFKATGVFSAPGRTLVKLKGAGTPITSGVHNFVISYDNSQCAAAVTTLPVGGGVPADFTLTGTAGNCVDFELLGSYITGTALNSSNQVVLNVFVNTIGTYDISTVLSNGIVFSGSGTLGEQGNQTVVLTGSGTPLITGPTNIPVEVGSSSCSFSIDVTGPAVYTIDCGSAIINGIYTEGVDLDASNTVEISVNVATAGGYNISANVNGMTFSAAGDFATAPSTERVILAANGIPFSAGSFSVLLNAGTSPCSFDVLCQAGGPAIIGGFHFVEGGNTFDGNIVDAGFDVMTAPPYQVFGFLGQTALGETFELDIADLDNTIQNGEVYKAYGAALTENLAGFYLDSPAPAIEAMYMADPTFIPNTLEVVVTSHNTSTRTITGTFSGTVLDSGSLPRTITGGTFTVTYP